MAAAQQTTQAGAAGRDHAPTHEDSCDGAGDQPPDPGAHPDPDAGPVRRSGGVVVSIDDAADALDPDALTWLRNALLRAVESALALEGADADAPHEVRVRIVGDDEMGALHGAHTGDPATTDVLTFDLRDENAGPLDVDIVICADEAARQAAERTRPAERELLLYALHGVLHCLGHDDHDDEAYARMHAREDEVLSKIGVGALFADPADREGAQ
ncbi:MAG: rRNA maturation RNase YbeY [Phycisphaerales bacterium]